jgi:MFS family permease
VLYILFSSYPFIRTSIVGTHLYVLYEGYGYSVASLYCLGYITGGLMSPITGPLIDKMGRKKAAILYCALEMFINWLEQYPILPGLMASRMMGGFTTNLLSSVFETWLDSEYRKRGFDKDKYEIIMRDSVIVSNLAAIFSGYLSHALAERFGNVGPFKGAVTCTAIALAVVVAAWTENYGSNDKVGKTKSMLCYLKQAVAAFKADNKMLRIGVIQGFSEGAVSIFIFLWAPALRQLSKSADKTSLGLVHGEPAYGLIFGAFMAAGVLGGLVAPTIRKAVSSILSPMDSDDSALATIDVDGEIMTVRPMAVEFMAATCYATAAGLLLVPCIYAEDNNMSFSVCLLAFLILEFLIGTFRPCEGVIRSLYFPVSCRASIMSIPRILVNVAVSIGVASTNFVRWVRLSCAMRLFTTFSPQRKADSYPFLDL